MPAVGVHVQVLGTGRARRLMRRFASQMPRVMGGALYRRAEEVMTEAKTIVPHRTGVLQDSGHVQPPQNTKSPVPVVVLGFGGPAAPYAKVQHQNLKFRHAPGRQALYLLTPALRQAPSMGPKIGAEVFVELQKMARVG